jgi:thiol-disulfide isomerase/thioredoxin
MPPANRQHRAFSPGLTGSAIWLLSLFVGWAGGGLWVSGGQASTLLPQAAPKPQPEERRVVEGSELIGTKPPEWDIREWIGSAQVSLASLRGKVVLVRWFAGSGCPYCAATAPALNRLHQDFARRGLIVIGLYHHKAPGNPNLAAVRELAREYGFEFPVGVDRDWRTLREWWLDGHDRSFTSVSFLLDREGAIREVHPGGVMAIGTPDYAAMRSKIEELLRR